MKISDVVIYIYIFTVIFSGAALYCLATVYSCFLENSLCSCLTLQSTAWHYTAISSHQAMVKVETKG